MSSKRPSLAETMRQAVQGDPTPPPAAAAPVPSPIAARPPESRPAGFYAATRAGKKKVTAALSPGMHKALKSLAVERETTTEGLIAEALADLLRKHGKPFPEGA